MLAKIYAVLGGLALLFGVLKALMAYSLIGADPELIARYLGSKSTGQAIDRGIYMAVIGFTMLLFAQIAMNVQKLVDKDK